METEGRIWKSKKQWLVEVPALDVMTQGKTKKEALSMIRVALYDLTQCYFDEVDTKALKIIVTEYKKGILSISSDNNKLFGAFFLRRQREKNGATVRQVAKRLGSSSPNAFSQYERGKTNMTLDQFVRLIQAANPTAHHRLQVS